MSNKNKPINTKYFIQLKQENTWFTEETLSFLLDHETQRDLMIKTPRSRQTENKTRKP